MDGAKWDLKVVEAALQVERDPSAANVKVQACIIAGMVSLHDTISSWGLPHSTVQKLEAWLSTPSQGWQLDQPENDAFFTLSEDDLQIAGLDTLSERRSILAMLRPAAGKQRHAPMASNWWPLCKALLCHFPLLHSGACSSAPL